MSKGQLYKMGVKELQEESFWRRWWWHDHSYCFLSPQILPYKQTKPLG